MTYISKQDQQREDWLFLFLWLLFLMPATMLDFSAKSGETALEFALAEFSLLQLLTEGPSPEMPLAPSSLYAVGSEVEGTCNVWWNTTAFVHRGRQNQHKMKSFTELL